MPATLPDLTVDDNRPYANAGPTRVTIQTVYFEPMSQLKKSFHIKSRDFIRAGEASISVQNLLKSMDFDPRLIRRVAICGYEGEMNVVMHGGDGTLSIELDSDKLVLEVTDDGQGIEDIELAMQAGYSTANDNHREMGFGAGMGLPNMKKNSDQIHVESKKNDGTAVRMIFFISEKGTSD